MYIPDSDADLQLHKEIVEVLEKFVSKLEKELLWKPAKEK
jgi:hypothetical protein